MRRQKEVKYMPLFGKKAQEAKEKLAKEAAEAKAATEAKAAEIKAEAKAQSAMAEAKAAEIKAKAAAENANVNATGMNIDELVIAGGFGSYLTIESAARIGLFPAELKDIAKSIGNTAIEGATALLINKEAREQERVIAQLAEYVELSTELKFNQYYVDCMMF